MRLLVRERPPLRLVASVATPDGPTYRWGADDPNPANVPNNMTFADAMPGGFTEMTCTLNRNPRQSYPDMVELSTVTVRGIGGLVAFEGRLEEQPSNYDPTAIGISPQINGWQAHLQDNNSAAMIYVDQDLTQWQDPSLQRQLNAASTSQFLNGDASVASNPSGSPAIVESLEGAWATGTSQQESWYLASPLEIAKLWYSFAAGPTVNTSDANWIWQAVLSSDDLLSADDLTTNLRAASGSGTLSATAARTAAMLFLKYAAAGGTDGVSYAVCWQAAVYGNHGLTLRGSAPQGLLASDVEAHALATWAPKLAFTTGASGTIQPSSFVIPQLAFKTATTVSAIVQQANQFELRDWAVWEGPTYWSNFRGEYSRSRNWQARVGPTKLQNAGPQVSNIWNGVIVSYTAIDGTTQTVGPPGSGASATTSALLDPDPQNPATLAGLDRWTLITLGTSTSVAAIQVGQIFLDEQKLVNTSGQAAVVGHIQDSSGVWWPAWLIRAGDYISFVDAADSSPRRIVSTSYDDSSKTNTIQLDQPPDGLQALLERLSVAISPLGLS